MSGPVSTAGVVCFRGDDVLLIKRGKPPRLGQWSIPGGRIEWGEAAIAAARRELMEETGVEAEILALVDVVDGVFVGDDGEVQRHYVMIDYAARWTSGEPVAGDDAADARFVPMSEVDAVVEWQETRRVIHEAWARFGGA
ncbi:NUDIX hydrolase [Caulobacter segnis]|uniref:NUDIX hydrolase n=1 Tax=Caulobacter segnis TaxID=88688 RepID=UPI00240ECECF|nr:NUDIX hydrolase [Caulobacter segnis]MDG2521077.1 NUDIX hydrolase [Caulobacter segnis]